VTAVTDPVLPALGVLTDRDGIGALLERTGWLDQPRVAEADVRLRWKPGTNVRAGVVVPTARGPAALLLAGFPTGGEKAAKLVDRARRLGAPALRDGTLVVLPAWADPALRGLVPATTRPLAYNPDRRWVGRLGRHVFKVHADPVPAAVRALTARFLPGARSVPPDGRMALTRWVPGRHPGVDDGLAVSAALAALHRTDPPPGLTALGPGDVLDAAARAASSVAAALPGHRDRLARLLEGLRSSLPGGWPSDRVVLHGDFSPDQVLIRPEGAAALLDLDRAVLGPSAWDGAQWTAAQLAVGTTPLPAPVPVPPVLLAAACLLRAPEPFRRLRAGWAALTMTLLATALMNVSLMNVSGGTNLLRALRALPTGLTPRRSWPERGGALAVEALTRDARVVAARVDGTASTVLDTADPELPALAAAAPGATVISHRAGRRAVLRRPGSYLKVVRPGHAARMVGGLATARDLLGTGPAVPLLPVVLAVDDTAGCVELAELPGPTLHRLLADDPTAADTLAGRTGAALAVLQSAPGAALAVHRHREEADVLRRWTTDATAWDGTDRTAAAEQLATRLLALPEPTWVPAHRDLHDKQLVAVGDRVGLLDLDTLCAADPALDIANLLAHLRLRVLQGHCTAAVAGRCAARLRASAGGRAGAQAVVTYTAATLLRLAAVYTFRPGPADLPDRLASAALELGRIP